MLDFHGPNVVAAAFLVAIGGWDSLELSTMSYLFAVIKCYNVLSAIIPDLRHVYPDVINEKQKSVLHRCQSGA